MRATKKSKALYIIYIACLFVFFYLPIVVLMIFSFNSSKSLTSMSGFSLRWYSRLINDGSIMRAVYVSLTIAIFATIISTILGTITAIGLSKSRRMVKELILNVNNIQPYSMNIDSVNDIIICFLDYILIIV